MHTHRCHGRTRSFVMAYRLLASADGGLHWSAAVAGTTQLSPAAPPATFLGFEDTRAGRWLSDSRDTWITHDGGLHWVRRAWECCG